VADKSIQLILGGLSQAIAYAEGLPLFAAKTTPGLFPNNAAGKQAAQRCLDDGYLRCLNPGYSVPDTAPPPAKKTKTPPETYVLTEKGFTFLFQQVSPRQVLEDLVRVLEQRHGEVSQLVQSARQMQNGFDALRTSVEKVVQTLQAAPGDNAAPGNLLPGRLRDSARQFYQDSPAPSPNPVPAATSAGNDLTAIQETICSQLQRWQTTSGASEDCPLPELFRQVRARLPRLTIGQFHDVLRRLHDNDQVYLHPWTGPLYDLPEPPQALLVGHEIAYYASLRTEVANTNPGVAAAGVRS